MPSVIHISKAQKRSIRIDYNSHTQKVDSKISYPEDGIGRPTSVEQQDKIQGGGGLSVEITENHIMEIKGGASIDSNRAILLPGTVIPYIPPVIETVVVTWIDGDGNTLEQDTVEVGTIPTYNGATPTKSATAQYTYTFNGWLPSVSAVSENTTYVAQFIEHEIEPTPTPEPFAAYQQLAWVGGMFAGDTGLAYDTASGEMLYVMAVASVQEGTGLICLRGSGSGLQAGDMDIICGQPENGGQVLYVRWLTGSTIQDTVIGSSTSVADTDRHLVGVMLGSGSSTLVVDNTTAGTDTIPQNGVKTLMFGGLLTEGYWVVEQLQAAVVDWSAGTAATVKRMLAVRRKQDNALGLYDIDGDVFYEAYPGNNHAAAGGSEVGTIVLHADGTYTAYNIAMFDGSARTEQVYVLLDTDVNLSGIGNAIYTVNIISDGTPRIVASGYRLDFYESGYWTSQSWN